MLSWGLLLGTFLSAAEPTVRAVDLPALVPVPLAVESGQPLSLTLEGAQTGAKYMLVVGSVARSGPPADVLFQSTRTPLGPAHSLTMADTRPPEWWQRRVADDRARMNRARRESSPREAYSVARFAETRGFDLFVGEDNLHDQREYVRINARLAHVGKHCLIYVDQAARVDVKLIDDVARTFDDVVYPTTRATFGVHRDVDRDGKFSILLTPWLGKLSLGKVTLSGFVRGADFYRDVEPPFSNQCDMLYLNSTLQPGEHLRTILAHEYTHAITFSEHTFGEYLPGGQGEDEEAWLGEAMAHLAENIAGQGWSNLDYRISTYLSETNQHRLVVPDYFQAGLWRSHGCRGATYLFLRYLVDRFGPELLGELSRSNLEGIENVEVATQTQFAELFRDWSVSLAVASMVGHPVDRGIRSIPLQGRLGERMLAGVRTHDLTDADLALSLAPTSWTSVVITVEPGAERQLDVQMPASAEMVATLVRLPDDSASATMAVSEAGQNHVALSVTSPNAVRWQSISWERLRLRQESARENEKIARILPAAEILGAATKEGVWTSDPIDLAEFEGDAVVFKLIGLDEKGRFVSAWHVYGDETGADSSVDRDPAQMAGDRRDHLRQVDSQ